MPKKRLVRKEPEPRQKQNFVFMSQADLIKQGTLQVTDVSLPDGASETPGLHAKG